MTSSVRIKGAFSLAMERVAPVCRDCNAAPGSSNPSTYYGFEIIYMIFSLHIHLYIYFQISNIRRSKSQNLNVSRLVLHLSLPNLLKPCVKLRMKMCSNYIWLINNSIAHKGVSYIRDLTVYIHTYISIWIFIYINNIWLLILTLYLLRLVIEICYKSIR